MRSPPRLPEEPVIHTRGPLAIYAVVVAVLVLLPVIAREYVLRHQLYARPLATRQASAAPQRPASSTPLVGVAPDSDFTHGLDLVRLGKFQDAEPYFRRAVARDSNDPRPLQYLALDLDEMGRATEGLRLVRAGADRQRTDARFQEAAAGIALDVHDFQTAYAYGHRALLLDSTDALPWAIVAHAAFGTNRMTESDSDYRRVARLDPSFFTRMPFEAQIRDEVDKLVQEH